MILPRVLRDANVIERVRAAEDEHVGNRRAGSYSIKVHHDGTGYPVKVEILRGAEEILLLKDSA